MVSWAWKKKVGNRESAVTVVMGMEECCSRERALPMVSWAWKKKVCMRESAVTVVMGM
ncbi:hypothetical protein DPMN_163556 [Dreissena polymorpha]|uniref:Uncharacterized protein n=1 Tax=Dreissena polymorpha TaxID=45954 RepID=A0A9D4IRG0_DREPO|nr:hypothetical protein DPMN_163556 [Dreissena polymorpha]